MQNWNMSKVVYVILRNVQSDLLLFKTKFGKFLDQGKLSKIHALA
jgi:hypothetical protein